MEPAKKAVDSVAEGVKKVAIGGEGKKAKKDKKASGKDGVSDSIPLEMNPPPAFLQSRIELFDRLKKEYDEEIAKKPREPSMHI